MKIGYARVSTKEQNLDLQIDALKAEGCLKIYQDNVSGVKSDRPQLTELLENVREGDTIIIWKLDRLGRSIRNLIDLINFLNKKKVNLKSINDPVDTSTPQGRFLFNLSASLAELERDTIRERTLAGLDAARARGRKGGKPAGLSIKAQNIALAAETLYKSKQQSVRQIAKQLGITTSTLYRYLRYRGVEISAYQKIDP